MSDDEQRLLRELAFGPNPSDVDGVFTESLGIGDSREESAERIAAQVLFCLSLDPPDGAIWMITTTTTHLVLDMPLHLATRECLLNAWLQAFRKNPDRYYTEFKDFVTLWPTSHSAPLLRTLIQQTTSFEPLTIMLLGDAADVYKSASLAEALSTPNLSREAVLRELDLIVQSARE